MCERCPINCLQCNIKGCTQFSQDKIRKTILENQTCECKDGFYQLSNQAQCQKCPYNCLTCDNQGKCLSCDSTSKRKSIPLSEFCECQDGFYEDQNSKESHVNVKKDIMKTKVPLNVKNASKILKIAQDQVKTNTHNSIQFKKEIQKNTPVFASQNSLKIRSNNANQDTIILVISVLGIYKINVQVVEIKAQLLDNQICKNKHANVQKAIMIFKDSKTAVNVITHVRHALDQTKNSGLTCFQKDFRVFDKQSNSCICITGYYENQQNEQCEKYNYSCKE
ncbi:hypothetical protein ABPG72_000633 [Tetrahymena utriculariae]